MKKRNKLFKDYLQEYKNIWKRILGKSKLITAITKIIVGIIKTIVSISFLLNAVVILLLAVMVCWVYFLIDAEAKVIFTNIEVGSIIKLIENKLKIEFSLIGSALIAIIGLKLFLHRLEKQEKQIDLQRKQRTDDRFTTAVELLGSSETSARTGAIYSLYHLAIEDEKYRKEVAQILCSHIRSKTNEAKYKEEHKDRPSNEIQSTIDLLLKDKDGNKGLYCQDFAKEKSFPQANFEYAYLVKVDFYDAQCQGAGFSYAQCQGADFRFAQCQGAKFNEVQCQGADFFYAQCQKAYFIDAQCQGAKFTLAQCQGANFTFAQWQEADFNLAQCQGAYFDKAQCQGAVFLNAQCQGAYFRSAQCQGANFYKAQCQGAGFNHAQFQGVNFSEAQCQGAYFYETQCKGAYAGDEYIEFKDRIGKETELKTMKFAGELTKKAIENIEAAKNYLDAAWYQKMQKIIDENKGKKADEDTIPEGIKKGKLADNAENRAIAEKNWEELEKIKKKKLKEKLRETIYKNEK